MGSVLSNVIGFLFVLLIPPFVDNFSPSTPQSITQCDTSNVDEKQYKLQKFDKNALASIIMTVYVESELQIKPFEVGKYLNQIEFDWFKSWNLEIRPATNGL